MNLWYLCERQSLQVNYCPCTKMSSVSPVKVFISYAHEDQKLMLALEKHLSALKRGVKIKIWNDRMITPGNDWEKDISDELSQSDIVVFLVSSNFAASDFIWDKEVPKALEREKKKECKVVPILLRPFFYEDTILAKKAMLPKNAKNNIVPVVEWRPPDKAFESVVRELKKVIEEIKKNKAETAKSIFVTPPDESSFTLKDIWSKMPLKKGTEAIRDIHQINREAAFGKVLQTLEDPAYNGHNLFYFITSCTTQSPDNLANRLFNHFYTKFDKYKCSADDFNIIKPYYLKIRDCPKSTWDTFWHHFIDNLGYSPSDADADFATFVKKAPELTHPFTRSPFFCRLVDIEWTNTSDMGEHLKYIVHQFSMLPRSAHKFVFFFLIELNDLHNCYCFPDNDVTKKFQKIKTFCSIDYDYEVRPYLSLIEILDYVKETDLKSWLNSLLDWPRERTLDAYFQMLLSALLKELNKKELSVYKKHKAFNMEQLVIMQRFAYPFIK
jgi:hypothetical protein